MKKDWGREFSQFNRGIVKCDDVLEIVASDPSIDVDGVRSTVSEDGIDLDAAEELLAEAVGSADVVGLDGKHWIVRKGKYSYQNYDHEL